MASPTVVVFGPTGGVGRAAALEAAKRGAKVWLGMRDTSKQIGGLSAAEESLLGFQRVQADLSDPSSVTVAVKTSGATHAFMYLLFDAKDGMRGTLTALKDAGIKYLVFLSSMSVKGNLRDIPPSSGIPYLHGRVELLAEELGLSISAIRPGYFSTNMFWLKSEVQKGEVGLYGADGWFDYVDRDDIGAVAGAILAEKKFQDASPGHPGKPIYVYGPELVQQHEAFRILGKVLGKEIKVRELTKEEYLERAPLPKEILEGVATMFEKARVKGSALAPGSFEEAHADFERLVGRKLTGLEESLEKNKAGFEV